MFAFIIPGRPVQQTSQVPDAPERFVASIESAQDLNHIGVFLTGVSPFPDGYGCTIHLEVPGKGWSLIGGLSNAKPSAIFRLRGTLIPSTQSQTSGFSISSTTATSSLSATLGILCEPLSSIDAQLSQLSQGGSTDVAASGSLALAGSPNSNRIGPNEAVQIAQKVAMNLFNNIGGFVQPLPDGSGSWVEFGVVEKWYRNFERKLKTGGTAFLFNE